MKTGAIPPAVRLEFEILANKTSALTGLDVIEKGALSQEFQTLLEGFYREGLDQDLSSADAQQWAIQRFGDPHFVARSMGGIEAKTYFINENNRLARLIFFMFSCAVIYLPKVVFEHGPQFYFDYFFVNSFPQFLGSGLVTVALLYLAVRVKPMGHSMRNHVKVYFPKLKNFREESAAFDHTLSVLSAVFSFLIIYACRSFLCDFFIAPYAQLIVQLGGKIQWFVPAYKISNTGGYYALLPGIAYIQILGLMSAASEIFGWSEKMQAKNKHLSWFFYIFPKQLTKLFFPPWPWFRQN